MGIFYLHAATTAFMGLIPRMTHGRTGKGLNIPMRRETPRMTIEQAQGYQVTLLALVTHGGIKPQGKLKIGYIVMAVDNIGTPKTAVKSRPLRSEERRVGKECRSRW